MQSLDNISPDVWRKPVSQQASSNEQPMYGEQKPFVDTLRQTREKKWFFDTVDNSEDLYFPYGAPGHGAPLRNPDTNEVVSRLPHIEENLWKNKRNSMSLQQSRNEASPTRMNNNFEYGQNKRQEIHNFIDEITKPKQTMNNFNIDEQKNNFYSRPKKVKNIDPNHYWNDWFGRPGGGAPNMDLRKQNLENMLEPHHEQHISSRGSYRPVYDPTSSLNTPRQKFKSDHHNRYEVPPPPQKFQR